MLQNNKPTTKMSEVRAIKSDVYPVFSIVALPRIASKVAKDCGPVTWPPGTFQSTIDHN
jgi:hypothetical protein